MFFSLIVTLSSLWTNFKNLVPMSAANSSSLGIVICLVGANLVFAKMRSIFQHMVVSCSKYTAAAYACLEGIAEDQ